MAWIFYSLTSHKIPTSFERVIQALIFTLIVQVLVSAQKKILLYFGQTLFSLGEWTKNSELVASLLTAVCLGVLAAYIVQSDLLHRLFRQLGVSSRSSQPSEWHGIFSKNLLYVVVHMKDGRRLFGWPSEWPSDHERGHFFITSPSWIIDKEERKEEIPLNQVEGILLDVKDVQWIELIKRQENQ